MAADKVIFPMGKAVIFSHVILARQQRKASWEGAHVICFVQKLPRQSSHGSPLYCGFPHEYCLCTLSVLGKVVSLSWVVRILLCWHFLFLKITPSHWWWTEPALCPLKALFGGCSDRWPWQFCWALGSVWPQNTRSFLHCQCSWLGW